MSFRKIAAPAALLVLLSALAPLGCGRKGGEEGEEIKALPDTLESFSQKIAWLIPRSFESLEFQCRNRPDQIIDAAINLNQYVPPERFFSLFEGVDVTYRNLYYGWEGFSAVFPVDPSLPMDSTLALLRLEAVSRLTEQIRLVEEQVGNITDEVQRKNVEGDLTKMRAAFEYVREHGVSLYGAEVKAYPEDLKNIVLQPDGLVRVIFPGVPNEGSWVRTSPFRFERLLAAGRGGEG